MSADLKFTIARSPEELERLNPEWDAFIENSGSDIYFMSTWIDCWWKYYGRNRDLRCFLIRKQHEILAALPFCIDFIRVGMTRTKLARFVGSDFTIPVFFPAIVPGSEQEALSAVLDYLFQQDQCVAVSLSPLSSLAPFVAEARALFSKDNNYSIRRDDMSERHISFSLPDNFESYLKSLAKQTRGNIGRDSRRLAEHAPYTHNVITGPGTDDHFEAFANLHGKQWQAVGRPGHFGDWPDSLDFNRELYCRFAAKGNARLYEITANSSLISAQYCYVLGNRCYWRLPARQPDEELEKRGLGRLGLVKMIEELIGEGVSMIEAGPGQYEYKIRHGGTDHPLTRLLVCGSRTRSKILSSLLIVYADLLHLVYYRLWYLKLSPHVKYLRRPLWSAWIRTRI